MREVLPGIWHWSVMHDGIKQPVHSYYVADAAALIDPMIPAEGVEWLSEYRPERIILTNRHHFRGSQRFVDAYGCPVFCHEAGLHEFANGPQVEGFAFGETVAPGITARELGSICPEDTALHIDVAGGVLALADGLVRGPADGGDEWGNGPLAFVPDFLMVEDGDDPEPVKAGLTAALQKLLDQETFDSMLFAHGEPMIGGANDALRDFLKETGSGV